MIKKISTLIILIILSSSMLYGQNAAIFFKVTILTVWVGLHPDKKTYFTDVNVSKDSIYIEKAYKVIVDNNSEDVDNIYLCMKGTTSADENITILKHLEIRKDSLIMNSKTLLAESCELRKISFSIKYDLRMYGNDVSDPVSLIIEKKKPYSLVFPKIVIKDNNVSYFWRANKDEVKKISLDSNLENAVVKELKQENEYNLWPVLLLTPVALVIDVCLSPFVLYETLTR